MNVSQIVSRIAPLYRARPIMHFRDRAVSIDDFLALIASQVELIAARGVVPGDRIVLLAANKPEWLAGYFAVMSIGAVLVPVNPALTAAEIAQIVDDCTPKLALVDDELAHLLDASKHKPILLPLGSAPAGIAAGLAPLDIEPHHPAIIFYTSGTTGRPKGVVLSHGAVWSTMTRTAPWIDAQPTDRALVAGPLAFIMHSTICATGCIAGGATLVVMERFHPGDAWALIERHRITTLIAVPTMYVMLLEWAEAHELRYDGFRVCNSGGAHLPWALMERFQARFGQPILNGWGMTEGTPVAGYHPPYEGSGRPDSIGRALPGCEIKVVDGAGREVADGEVGELIFHSPSNMNGYFNRPEATAETLRDGWLWSGDLARRDAEGHFFIVGRSKDMVIHGGANIYPAELESVLATHPAVAECAVIGVPDPRFGESVIAYVVARRDTAAAADELKSFMKDRLAAYKIPEEIIIVGDLPRGPTGKVLKRALQEMSRHGERTSA